MASGPGVVPSTALDGKLRDFARAKAPDDQELVEIQGKAVPLGLIRQLDDVLTEVFGMPTRPPEVGYKPSMDAQKGGT